MSKTSFGAALGLLLSTICGMAQTPPPVPTQFQEAATTLTSDIANFGTTIDSVWDKSTYPVLKSSQLQTANSDLTTDLLQTNYYEMTVLSELNSLQALGVQSITFHINFPAMYQPYYSNPADYQSYLAFYTQLVNEIRSRGLKVVIESTIAIVYPGNNSGVFIPYYQSLDWATYESQRAQLVTSIAQLFKPDYLVVVAEPETEANSTGQLNANTVSGSTEMVQLMLANMQAGGVTGVQVGAGCGTWNPGFLQFIQSFSTLPLDFVDMHIYPVNLNNLPDALTALNMIRAGGKQPSMSEYWSYKETDTEYLAGLSYTAIFARDAFSFWYPIDISFLQMISDFGNYGHFLFMTPFWSHYFAAYMDYSQFGNLPDATLIADSDTASTQANMTGTFTPTAAFYESMMLKGVADTTPPSTPAAPSLVSYSQTEANLAWTPSKDNVGVAAYKLYRNGIAIASVSSPLTYYDPTLSPDTTYTYTISAFDASGNESPRSAPLTMTTYSYPDNTPPSVPTGVQATEAADTLMSLTWLPSVDNVAVMGYEIYRGISPTSITPYSTSVTNSFSDSAVGPSKTYYYQVDAYDTSGNHSARSAIVMGVTLPDVTPPSVPTDVSGIAQPGPMVSLEWTASVDDYMVANYLIYRGISATNLQVIGWSPASQVSYVDNTAISGKTYYYAVAAVDVAKNQSAQSAPIEVSVP